MKKTYLSILFSIFVAAFLVGCGEKSNDSAEDVAEEMKDASAEAAEQSEDAAKEASKAAENHPK